MRRVAERIGATDLTRRIALTTGPDEIVGLAAGSNREVVARQARDFGVEHTTVGIEESVQLVREVDADVVLNGITGSVGLGPTLATLERGTTLALANKE